MTSKIKPLSRQWDIVIQELADEILVYDLLTNKAHSLNKASALVWRFADGKSSVTDIAGQMSKELNENVSEDLVWLAVIDLDKAKLLVSAGRRGFDGVSRRDLIRKVGIASILVLPVVSSLTAPVAANAASAGACVGLGQPCTTPGAGPCCAPFICEECFTGTCQPDPGGLGGCL